MKYARTLVTIAWLVASTSLAGPTMATPPSGFAVAPVANAPFGGINENTTGDKTDKWDVKLTTKDTSDVWVVRNSIAAGGQSGWHRHPGPSLITVTIGEVTAYESSDPLCAPKVYRAGEGFVDHGDHAHLLRNETSAAAETVAVQFLPAGSTRRIDVDPAPNNCTF
jgi:quercetin dioxygenase-like cupin family protein